jgi:hypothetical protein
MCLPDDIPSAPDRDDLATVRAFNFALKTACDEFHDDPFNLVACAPVGAPHRARSISGRCRADPRTTVGVQRRRS